MANVIYVLDMYRLPSKEIRHNRKVFYDSHRKRGEPIEKWLERIGSGIDYCDFPRFFEYLLIDKIVCELRKNEMEMIQKAAQRTWSFKQLHEFFVGQQGNLVHQNVNDAITINNGNVYVQPDKIMHDVVKKETVSVCLSHE